jgi:hypothetical protein
MSCKEFSFYKVMLKFKHLERIFGGGTCGRGEYDRVSSGQVTNEVIWVDIENQWWEDDDDSRVKR